MQKDETLGGKSSGNITDTKSCEFSFEEHRYSLWLINSKKNLSLDVKESVFIEPVDKKANRVDENVAKRVSENVGLGSNDGEFEILGVGDIESNKDGFLGSDEAKELKFTRIIDEEYDGKFENLLVGSEGEIERHKDVVLGLNEPMDCKISGKEENIGAKNVAKKTNRVKKLVKRVKNEEDSGKLGVLEVGGEDETEQVVSEIGSDEANKEVQFAETMTNRVFENVVKKQENVGKFGDLGNKAETERNRSKNLAFEAKKKCVKKLAKRVINEDVGVSEVGSEDEIERLKDVVLVSTEVAEPVVSEIGGDEADKGVKVEETISNRVVENLVKKQENVGEFGDLGYEDETESNRSKNLDFEANEGVLVEPLESEGGAAAAKEGEKAAARKKVRVIKKVVRKVLRRVKKDEIDGKIVELGECNEVEIMSSKNLYVGSDDIDGDMVKEVEKDASGRTVRVIKRVVRKVPKRVWKDMNDGELVFDNEGEIKNSKLAVMDSNEFRTSDCDISNSVKINKAKKVVSKGSKKVQKEENNGGFREFGVGNEAKIDGPKHIDVVHTEGTIKDQKRVEKEEGDVELKKFRVDNEAEMQNPMHIVSYSDEYRTPDSDIVKGVCSLENGMDVDETDSEGGERMEGATDGVKSSDVSSVKKDAIMVDDMALSEEMEAIMRRKRRRTEIFVGGLDKDAVEDDVRNAFKEVGEIVELTVKMHETNGKNKGFAFIRYASAADAEKAVDKSGTIEVLGKQCCVEFLKGNDTIFLGKIDRRWKNADIIKLLQDVGVEKIDKVTIKFDAENPGCNLGYAFLELETIRYAQKVFGLLEKRGRLGNRMIRVEWAKPLSETVEEDRNKVRTVYAEHLPASWDEEKVKNHFKKYGEIENVVLARNLVSPIRKDFAFINYKTREAAVTCIKAFTPELLHNEGSKVHVKVSLAKSTSKAKHASNPVIKISSHGKPKAAQTVVHPIRRRSEEKSSSHYYNNKRIVVQPNQHRSKRETTSHHCDSSQVRASTNDELVQLLREQASWRQPETSLRLGSDSLEYTYSLPARKRQYTYLEDEPIYSDPRGYPRLRTESTFPALNPSHSRLSPGQGIQSLPHYSLSNQSGVPRKIDGYLNLSQPGRGSSSGGGSDVYRRY